MNKLTKNEDETKVYDKLVENLEKLKNNEINKFKDSLDITDNRISTEGGVLLNIKDFPTLNRENCQIVKNSDKLSEKIGNNINISCKKTSENLSYEFLNLKRIDTFQQSIKEEQEEEDLNRKVHFTTKSVNSISKSKSYPIGILKKKVIYETLN